MNPLPPQVANEMAFNDATKLIQSYPRFLSMELIWWAERYEWECRFVDHRSFEYSASHAKLANAIYGAIDTLHECEEVSRNHEAIKAGHMAMLANSKPFDSK